MTRKHEDTSSFSLGLLIAANLVVLLSGLIAAPATQPQSQVDTQSRQILAITYPSDSSVSIEFQGTFRHPRANGEAKVERKLGFTEIEVELDEMKPPTGFGQDLNSYVLWVATPEGKVENLGEFLLNGNRSKLNVTTRLSTFGMFVTAEPHFLVEHPSPFVVLENSRLRDDLKDGAIRSSRVTYQEFAGEYDTTRESLAEVKERKGPLRPHLLEARTALELARRAGASRYAPDLLQQAEQALQQANADPISEMKAHEAVRIAAKAEGTARENAYQEALQAEREAYSSRIDRLERSVEQAEDQAEQVRLEAERKKLEAEMERRARRDAQERAQAAEAEAAQARHRAEELAVAKEEAEEDARQARRSAQEAMREAEQAREQQENAMRRLRETMSAVTDVRESARGLIINLPDILFEFDKAELKPDARIVLAKLSGVLAVVPEYQLEISGHTDSVGSEEYNLKLSRRRAESVRNFLVIQGVSRELTDVVAMGESSPVASNDSAQGRQQNRRVEILVEDTLETTPTASAPNQ